MPLAASAGLSLDEALARHRALADGSAGAGLTPITLDIEADDGITAAVGGPGNNVPPLRRPVLRGEGGIQVKTRATLADGAVEARLGVAYWIGDPHPWSLDGSSFDVPFGAGALYLSVERRHWGPSWTGSLILDGGARPVPAVGWRKVDPRPFGSPWLAWLGPWNVDLFAGELVTRSGPSHPHLLGARVQVMPLPGLELAVSRTMQWGGSGRPESLRSLARALFGQDNVDPGQSDAGEPGNGLAGFDARYTVRLDASRSVSIYGQAIGEDEAQGLPSHYLGSVGADVALPIGRAITSRVFVEYADTSMSGLFGRPLAGAYRHHIYTDGYVQQGDPLGHPAGGDVRLASIGMFVDGVRWSGVFMLHRGSAYATSQLYPGGGRLAGADAEVAWQVDARSRVGASFTQWRDPFGTRTRGQLWWRTAWP